MAAKRRALIVCLVVLVAAASVSAQEKSAPDPLGRETPRGTVVGFMTAARDGKFDIAAQYLTPGPRGEDLAELAEQLYTVLNVRLPARLSSVSDRPDGSLANPLIPDREVIGVIPSSRGELSIVVERTRPKTGARLWLFSRTTLEWVPDAHGEIDLVSIDRYLPRVLRYRLGGIRLFEWLMLVLVLPLAYRLLGVVDWLIARASIRWPRRLRWPIEPFSTWMPGPVRLLVLAVMIRVVVSTVDLPLAERQLWGVMTAVFTIVGVVGLVLRAVDRGERYLLRRARGGSVTESRALLRLVRRVVQALVITAAGVVALEYFGFDPTAALAGLGIGGIAVALAAQKTLENVIGGFSLVFDKAVRVGDFLRMGDLVGTVDHVGLRSTRIRTLDRTLVSVPNGQMATANIETISQRDKFWFHHVVGLSYDTTAAQMRHLEESLATLLRDYPGVDAASARVTFIRFGAYSLDVELFAYILVPDWERFLQVQQLLLLRVMETIEAGGARIAFPTQTVRVESPSLPRAAGL